jgi:predicted permease
MHVTLTSNIGDIMNFLQDFRYALRTFRKTVGLTTVVVISLAIGIGANSAIFSVVDALLLRPLPYSQPERLANIWLHSPGIGIFRDWPSPGQYIDIQHENHSFDEMAIARLESFVLAGRDRPERVNGMSASSSLLQMLGAKPMLGRMLLPEEDKPGKAPVAVFSHRAWQRLLNADPNIVGTGVTLDGKTYTVAGVLVPGFSIDAEAMPAESPMDKVDVFLPLPLGPDAVQNRRDENYNILVRLKQGTSVQQAQADVDVIASHIREKDKRDRTFGMTVTGLQEQVVGDVRRAVLVLLGSVALVLLIACANVANLLLTRAAGREKELAIRTAMGAGGLRIVRQLLTESILLALMGGALGLAMAKWTLYAIRNFNPGNIPRLEEVHINLSVLAFTFGISILTGILFGLAPAWRALKLDLNTSLKAGGRSGHSAGGLGLGRNRLRGLLVVCELALSMMLLIGAGLLVRSFVRLQAVPPGFSTDRILSMRVVATGPKFREAKSRIQFYQEIGDRIRRLPGVKNEGLVSVLPLTGTVGWGGIKVEGYTPPPGQEIQADLRLASTNYFSTVSIPLIQGRYFSESDNDQSRKVAIVDGKFAQRFWPRDNPIGKRIWFNPKEPFLIVGVVGVVKQDGLNSDGKIAVYFPHLQEPGDSMALVASTSSDPEGFTSAIGREIHDVDSSVAVYDVRTMQDLLDSSLRRQRFSTSMLSAFAAFALLLAAVGVYGVMSYLVSQNTHDIGLRMALGARPGDVVRLVVRQGMELAVIGMAAGLIGAVALTRLMASLLFGVAPTDPLTFSAIALILAGAALLATAIPALRAASLDPLIALRQE